MAQDRPQTPAQTPSRAEKLSLLSALLGPETLAKLQEENPPAEPALAEPGDDAGRAAWHRNKLLERLRRKALGKEHPTTPAKPQLRRQSPMGQQAQTPNGTSGVEDAPKAPAPQESKIGIEHRVYGDVRSSAQPPQNTQRKLSAANRQGLPASLAAIADPDALQREHPAVIAGLMKTLSREERIAAIKALPGPIARSILHRLK